MLGKDIGDHLRGPHFFRVRSEHNQALLDVFHRDPRTALDEIPLEVFQQLEWFYAILPERLVGNFEELRQRLADRGRLDLKLVDQHFLDVEVLAPGGASRQVHLLSRQHSIGNQVVVLSSQHRRRTAALLECNGQGFAEVQRPLFGDRRERVPAFGVDHLHDADQFAVGPTVDHRSHQHLLGAIAGTPVHFLEELQVRTVASQLRVVIDVADVDQLSGQRDKAGNALLVDW